MIKTVYMYLAYWAVKVVAIVYNQVRNAIFSLRSLISTSNQRIHCRVRSLFLYLGMPEYIRLNRQNEVIT